MNTQSEDRLLQPKNRKNFAALGAFAFVAVLLGGAAVQSFASGPSVTVKVSEDTFVSEITPYQNHAGLDRLRTDAEPDRLSFLKFKVPEDGRQIVKATFRIHTDSQNSAGYLLYSTPSNWTASALRFHNRPDLQDKLGASGGFNDHEWTSINVTSYVKKAGVYGFGMKGASSKRLANYDSGESSYKPQLVLEYASATPTPTRTATPTPTRTPTVTPKPSVSVSPPVASAGTLMITPASPTIPTNASPTFEIRENSGTVGVNAVQANLTYDPAKLQYVGVDSAGSAFPLVANTTATPGSLKFARAINGGQAAVTGNQLVAKVTFKVIGTSGTAAINFATGSAIVTATGTDTLKQTTGAVVTISGTVTSSPTPSRTPTPSATPTPTRTPTPTVTPVAASGTLLLTPASPTVISGSNTTFEIRENSGTVAVNAVQANLTYDPAKLQYLSVDNAGSAFPLDANTAATSGSVKFARATNGGQPAVTGNQLVTKVTFKVIGASGSTTAVTFAAGSAIVSSIGTDALKQTTGANVTITGTVIGTPTPTRTPTPTPTSTPSSTPTPTPVASGTLLLTPAAPTTPTGANVTLEIRENSGSVSINAVQANLTYDHAKLQYVSADGAGSAFPLEANTTTASGSVKFARATNGGQPAVTGSQLVLKVTFKVLASSGIATINFAPGSALVTTAGTDALKQTTGAVVSVGVVPDSQAPTAPTGVTATANSTTQVTITWNASTDNVRVASYHVLRNNLIVGTVSGTTLTYVDNSVQPGTTYTYRVTALDAVPLQSPLSAAVVVSTPLPPTLDTTPPSVPTNFTAVAISRTQVNLTWGASTDNVGVAGYRVYRNGVLLANTPATGRSYGDAQVSAGMSHSYTVTAFDAASNESAKTPSITVTTPSATPTPTPTPTRTPTPTPTPTATATPAILGGTLLLTPASPSTPSGSNVTFEVREDSGTVSVNAVQANLTYDPAKLQYVSTDNTGSDFPLDANTAATSGSLKFARALNGGQPAVTGNKLVLKVTFKVLASSGTTAVSFATGSAIVSTAGTDALKQTRGATITVGGPTALRSSKLLKTRI